MAAMRIFILGLFLLLITYSVSALQSMTIFIKESSYVIDGSNEPVSYELLERELSQQTFNVVHFDIDYCAKADTIANAYVALYKANPKLTQITTSMSAKHQTRQCSGI